MTRIQIAGNIPLNGELKVQGSKNAVLPIMAAAVLHAGRTVIHNCPRILDVEYMAEILRELGCLVQWQEHSLMIDAGRIRKSNISKRYASRLRASVILMGSLLGRCKEVQLPYPGGCAIGSRPIDLHISAMQQLGAVSYENDSMILLDGCHLKGNDVYFSFPSVGATENAILAAVLAEGQTRIHGCALEPEIEELCCFLNGKGACIQGAGTAELKITGVTELCDSQYVLMPDRIVAGTYLCAAAGTGGVIRLTQIVPGHLEALLYVLEKMGVMLDVGEDWILADASVGKLVAGAIETAPYPGFPTDLQSQLMAVQTKAKGISRISENLFESRFQTVKELGKMGARIVMEGRNAFITGVSSLRGTNVTARDLRGGAALVIAGLMAQEQTVVEGCHLIERGYEDICGDLRMLGADIFREPEKGEDDAAADEKKKGFSESTDTRICGGCGAWSGYPFRLISRT